MDVVLHYRTSQIRQEDIEKIAAGALQHFPIRHLPRFEPWFPSHKQSFALKPKRCPPLISDVDILKTNLCVTVLEEPVSCTGYDSTLSLLEFQPNVIENVAQEQTEMVNIQENPIHCEIPSGNEKTKLKRSWSVCTQRGSGAGSITPPSEELKSILNRLELNCFHRGRWIIAQSVCGHQSLDEVWVKLNRVLRHHFLPGCNATMRRDLNEIWVFCDLVNCEHTGTLLKMELKLTGNIGLFVHKHGIVLRV
ncbi:shieldin complex subunit 3 [Discoglossus pictus]